MSAPTGDSVAQAKRTMRALNVLAKWRTLLAGWQLGTRPKGDPECDAVSDHGHKSGCFGANIVRFRERNVAMVLNNQTM